MINVIDDFYSLPPRCRTKERLKKMVDQEYRPKDIDKAKQEIKDIILGELPENPYPESIFSKVSDKDLTELHDYLQAKGKSLDNISAYIGRTIHKGLIDQITKIIKGL